MARCSRPIVSKKASTLASVLRVTSPTRTPEASRKASSSSSPGIASSV